MKKLILALAFLLSISSYALAIPTLQLDIGGGLYDPVSETTIASTSNFTLYALLNDGSIKDHMFYISASVVPQQNTSANLGSFTFNGTPVSVTSDMNYGSPSFVLNGTKDLQSHGIFDTYFIEFAFTFANALQVTPYDVQNKPATAPELTGTGMYYVPFVVDTSGLIIPDTLIHFDLYSQKYKDGEPTSNLEFAPFSHDAQSAPVPEPSTIILLTTGLFGLVIYGKRRMAKNQ